MVNQMQNHNIITAMLLRIIAGNSSRNKNLGFAYDIEKSERGAFNADRIFKPIDAGMEPLC